MKKIRIISAVSLLLCAVMLLASCGGSAKVSSVLNSKAYESVTYKSSTEFTVQGTMVSRNGTVALFKSSNNGTETYTVYDLAQTDASKATIFTVTENATTDYYVYLSEDIPFFVVVKDDTTEADADSSVLYDLTGKEIATADDDEYSKEFADLIEFDKVVYRADAKGKITKAFDLPALGSGLPVMTHASDKYYYTVGRDSVLVYNKKGALVSNYEAPAYATGVFMGILNDGNIFVQYKYQLPSDAKEYSYAEGEKKYDLVTLVVSASNGSEKRVKADFQVNFLAARSVNESSFKRIASAVDNIAMINYIVDGKLINDTKLVSLKDSGKVAADLASSFANQDGEPNIINNNYVVFDNIEGKSFLATFSGKVVGEVSNADAFTEDYIISGNKVYNYSLELVYDAAAEKCTVAGALDHCVILTTDKGEAKILTGTTAKKATVNTLISESEAATKSYSGCVNDLFCIRESAGEKASYAFYNDCGEKLFTSATIMLDFEDLGDGLAIMVADDGTSTTVYRLSTKAAKK